MRKGLIKAGRVFLVALITFAVLEGILRLFGYTSHQVPDQFMASTPSGCFIADSSDGISLKTGVFEVTIAGKLSYIANHTKNGLRSTGKTSEKDTNHIRVALHGCSFTYGQGVNDEETYAHLLQAQFPKLEIQNHGVPGYGQIQLLNDLDAYLKSDQKPDCIILNYLPFHNERNSLNPNWRDKLRLGFEIAQKSDQSTADGVYKYPFATLENGQLNLQKKPLEEICKPYLLDDYLAFTNTIGSIINKWDLDENKDAKITEKIIDKIAARCKQHGVTFILSFMSNDSKSKLLLAHCKSNKIETVDISYDYTSKELTNHPSDTHPNPKAHKLIAKKLATVLNHISSLN